MSVAKDEGTDGEGVAGTVGARRGLRVVGRVIFLTKLLVSQECMQVKAYQIVLFIYVQDSICQLYFNKAL